MGYCLGDRCEAWDLMSPQQVCVRALSKVLSLGFPLALSERPSDREHLRSPLKVNVYFLKDWTRHVKDDHAVTGRNKF